MGVENRIRDNLREAIALSGLVVKEISSKSGIAKGTIDNWVGSNPTSPRVVDLVPVARVLEVSVEWIYDRSETPIALASRIAARPLLLSLVDRLAELDNQGVTIASRILEAAGVVSNPDTYPIHTTRPHGVEPQDMSSLGLVADGNVLSQYGRKKKA
jgi:transcriptional regulator with XRE-family HTH domain